MNDQELILAYLDICNDDKQTVFEFLDGLTEQQRLVIAKSTYLGSLDMIQYQIMKIFKMMETDIDEWSKGVEKDLEKWNQKLKNK